MTVTAHNVEKGAAVSAETALMKPCGLETASTLVCRKDTAVAVRSRTLGRLPVEEGLFGLDLNSLKDYISHLSRGRPRGSPQLGERHILNVPFSCCHGDLTLDKWKTMIVA